MDLPSLFKGRRVGKYQVTRLVVGTPQDAVVRLLKVAVKVLYPGIRDVVRIDMRVIKLMVRVYKWFVPVQNIEVTVVLIISPLRPDPAQSIEACININKPHITLVPVDP